MKYLFRVKNQKLRFFIILKFTNKIYTQTKLTVSVIVYFYSKLLFQNALVNDHNNLKFMNSHRTRCLTFYYDFSGCTSNHLRSNFCYFLV